MKRAFLLSTAAILLLGITQNFDGQEKSQSHRQLPIGINPIIEHEGKMAPAPSISRLGPNRWAKQQIPGYPRRMPDHLGRRDYRAIPTTTAGTLSRHELSGGVDTAWVRHYASDPMPGLDGAVDIAIDKSGNMVVTGYTTFREFGMDFYTIKYNASGAQIWSARYDGKSSDDVPTALCIDASGNVYVTGSSGNDCATIKYNASGLEQWIIRYSRKDNSWDSAADIAVDDSGNVYVAGISEVENTSSVFITIKYTPSGKEQWVAQYGGDLRSGPKVAAIVVDALGNVLVTGGSGWDSNTGTNYVTIKYNAAGALQWVARYAGQGNLLGGAATALGVDNAGNVYVTGTNYATIKYDAFGAQLWVAIYAGPDSFSSGDWGNATAIAVDDSGNVYVAGSVRGTAPTLFRGSDYATIKYNTHGVEQWVARYDGPSTDPPFQSSDAAGALALDDSGNVYVTGKSTSPGSRTGYDFATIKYNVNGVEQWAARYNGADNIEDRPSAIAVDDSGNVYATGACDIHYDEWGEWELSCDYATVKYNASGVEQWVNRYDGPGVISGWASDIAADKLGNVYVTGYSYADSSRRVAYVTIKYDATGAVQWMARCQEGNRATNIVVDGSGNAYVTGFVNDGGYMTVKYNASGVKQWVAHFNKSIYEGNPWLISLAVDRSGNVYVAGSIVSNGTSDYVTIKYDSSGIEEWVAQYDGPASGFDEATALAIDGVGNVYVTGRSNASGYLADHATIKYNSAGVEQWVARYDGPEHNWDGANDIAVDDSGNVYVTGSTRSSITGDDFVTIKYNASGISQWIVRYNGPENFSERATALVLDDAGNVYVTGGTNDDYATIKYNNSGAEQWVARYSSPGLSYDWPHDLAVDGSGNVFVTGTSTASGEDQDYATIKYNASGVEQWVALYSGPGNSYDEVSGIVVNDAGHVYVTGTSRGEYVYVTETSIVYPWSRMTTIKYTETATPVVMPDSGALPKDFSLAQNYPNPFNPATTIEFALPKTSFVTLKIYDLLGNEVATLVAEKLPAGTHQRVWEAKGLASGVYVYRLQAGEFEETKKLILLR